MAAAVAAAPLCEAPAPRTALLTALVARHNRVAQSALASPSETRLNEPRGLSKMGWSPQKAKARPVRHGVPDAHADGGATAEDPARRPPMKLSNERNAGTPSGHFGSGLTPDSVPSVEMIVAMMNSSRVSGAALAWDPDVHQQAVAASTSPDGEARVHHTLQVAHPFARQASFPESQVHFSSLIPRFDDAMLEEKYCLHEWSRQRPFMRISTLVVLAPLCATAVLGAVLRADDAGSAVLSRIGALCVVLASMVYSALNEVPAAPRVRARRRC